LDDAIFRDVYLVPSTGTDSMYIIPSNVSSIPQIAIGCVDTITGLVHDAMIIRCSETLGGLPTITVPDFDTQGAPLNTLSGVVAFDTADGYRPISFADLATLLPSVGITCEDIQPSSVSTEAIVQGITCPVPIASDNISSDVPGSVAFSRVNEILTPGPSITPFLTITTIPLAVVVNPLFVTSTEQNIYTLNTTVDTSYSVDITLCSRTLNVLPVFVSLDSISIPFNLNTQDETIVIKTTFLVSNISGVVSDINVVNQSSSATYTLTDLLVDLPGAVSSIPGIGAAITALALTILNPTITAAASGTSVIFTLNGVGDSSIIDMKIDTVRAQRPVIPLNSTFAKSQVNIYPMMNI